MLVEIDDLMRSLGARRPIFHSEADFQHEFAWQARIASPDLRVRLERPFPGRASGAIDVMFTRDSAEHAVELKYLTRLYDGEFCGEDFKLKNQGAQDVRSYDVCKDVSRIEAFCSVPGRTGSVVVLTNEPYYWKARLKVGTCAEAFDISGTRELTGELSWAEHTGPGTKKNREAPIVLTSTHLPAWKDYSEVSGKNGRFRYFTISVSS
jgi:hypothetical protein